MAERPTSKSTKAEILKMYDDLLRENTQLEAKVQKLQQEKRELEKGASKVSGEKVVTPPVSKTPAPSTLDGIIATLTALPTTVMSTASP